MRTATNPLAWRVGNMLASVTLGVLGAATFFGTAQAQTATAVEYYYAAWDNYFVTAFPDEITLLDGGAFGGNWKRTGESFAVAAQPGGGAGETCRFFSVGFAPRSSHFYTPSVAECAKVKTSPDWQYESIAFYLQPTDAAGACPAGLAALYRLYNEGRGGAPNHRYTTRKATVDTMRAQGWTSEGNGPDIIFACVPAIAPPATAKGVWTGTSNRNETVRIVILEDGTFYMVQSNAGKAGDGGIVQGTGSESGGTFASANARQYPVAQQAETNGASQPVTLTGSVVPQGALQWTITDAEGPRTVTGTYVAGSGQPVDPAAVAGHYTGISGHADGRMTASFTVAADGTYFGANGACRFAGTFAPRPSVAAFDWTVRSSVGECIFGPGPISGLLYFDAPTQKFHGLAPFDLRHDLYYLIGTRDGP